MNGTDQISVAQSCTSPLQAAFCAVPIQVAQLVSSPPLAHKVGQSDRQLAESQMQLYIALNNVAEFPEQTVFGSKVQSSANMTVAEQLA